MNKYLAMQKKQLEVIIGYINIIEECDGHIISGCNPEYFKAVRQEAIEKYSNEMANMVAEAIRVSKVKIFA